MLEIVGIIVLLAICLFVFRFLKRASVMTNTANAALQTSRKINMTIEIARQKVGDVSIPGTVTPEKQFYIGYIVAVTEEQSQADGWSPTMFKALVAKEAARVVSQDVVSSSEVFEALSSSIAGAKGQKIGKIDGQKLADPQSSQPYFVCLDDWLRNN